MSSRVRCSKPRATLIGAVTGVQGISWQELTFEGQSNHAGHHADGASGTTPCSRQRAIATYVREIA